MWTKISIEREIHLDFTIHDKQSHITCKLDPIKWKFSILSCNQVYVKNCSTKGASSKCWRKLTRGGGGVSQMLTIADGGGRGGPGTPDFGWRNMWTNPKSTFEEGVDGSLGTSMGDVRTVCVVHISELRSTHVLHAHAHRDRCWVLKIFSGHIWSKHEHVSGWAAYHSLLSGLDGTNVHSWNGMTNARSWTENNNPIEKFWS